MTALEKHAEADACMAFSMKQCILSFKATAGVKKEETLHIPVMSFAIPELASVASGKLAWKTLLQLYACSAWKRSLINTFP